MLYTPVVIACLPYKVYTCSYCMFTIQVIMLYTSVVQNILDQSLKYHSYQTGHFSHVFIALFKHPVEDDVIMDHSITTSASGRAFASTCTVWWGRILVHVSNV